jgi:uncharacterized protein YeaO (DUF488 family)
MKLNLKRVYEDPSEEDGTRILVDRLWPRGLTKEKARVDLWFKELAPSTELRKWFAHDPAKWPEFKARYKAELKQSSPQITLLKQAIARGTATLLYGARDTEHNEAVVLQELLSR